MKIAAAILLVVIMGFSFQPLAIQSGKSARTECGKKSCCKKMKHGPSKENESQNGSCKDCNVLMLCPICCVYLQSEINYTASIKVERESKYSFSNFFILSSYHAECWHPPEQQYIFG